MIKEVKLFRLYQLVFLIIFSTHAYALDTEIRILGLTTGGADAEIAKQQLAHIQTVWQNSFESNPYMVGVKVVNGGVPVLLTSSTLTGTALVQLNSALNMSALRQLRDTHQADVVLVFTRAGGD